MDTFLLYSLSLFLSLHFLPSSFLLHFSWFISLPLSLFLHLSSSSCLPLPLLAPTLCPLPYQSMGSHLCSLYRMVTGVVLTTVKTSYLFTINNIEINPFGIMFSVWVRVLNSIFLWQWQASLKYWSQRRSQRGSQIKKVTGRSQTNKITNNQGHY